MASNRIIRDTGYELWSNATQQADPPAGYTQADAQGNIVLQRALLASEASDLAALDAANTQNANQTTIQAKAQQALADNATYLAIASPTTAQAVSQVKALTQQVDAIIRIVLRKFDATT